MSREEISMSPHFSRSQVESSPSRIKNLVKNPVSVYSSGERKSTGTHEDLQEDNFSSKIQRKDDHDLSNDK
jgi:hypothetical protein